MKIGNKIYELRKNKKISQEILAEKVGVSRQTISNWETDETVPDIYQATLLAKALNISLDILVGNSKEENKKAINTKEEAIIIWQIIKQKLTEFISPMSYEFWFEDLNEVELKNNELIIYTYDATPYKYINEHYKEYILDIANNHYHYNIKSVKVVKKETSKN